MSVAILCDSVFLIYVLQSSYWFSIILINCTTVTGKTVGFKNHCQIKIREYVHTHETGVNTVVNEWDTSMIYLSPTFNAHER